MSPLFWDRLAREYIAEPPLRSLPGQWEIRPQSGESLGQNGTRAQSGHIVVPAEDGAWEWCADGRVLRGMVIGLAPIHDKHLRSIGKDLEHRIEEGAPWGEWLKGPSYVSPEAISEAADVSEFEQRVRDRFLPSICDIFRSPNLRIETNSERLPVARVKRVSVRAQEVLARRTEDWQHRTSNGVVPLRVLADVVDEQWHTYENRLTVRTVDRLVKRLDDRLSELKDYQRAMERLKTTSEGSILSAKRRYDRIAGAIYDKGLRAFLQATSDELAKMRSKLGGLRNQPLYARIPRLATVGSFRLTNLLRNEPRYRQVVRAWQDLNKQDETDSQLLSQHEIWQQTYRHFNTFGTLVVCQALDLLDFRCMDEYVAFAPGCELSLEQRGEQWLLRWESDGTLALQREGKECLRLIPLPCALAASSEDRVESLLKVLERSVPSQTIGATRKRRSRAEPNQPECRQVILYSASPSEWQALPNHAKRLLFDSHYLGTFPNNTRFMLPISPVDVDSTERVARALRWVTLAPNLLSYPPRVKVPTWAESVLEERAKLRIEHDNQAVVLQRTSDVDHEEIKNRLEVQRTKIQKVSTSRNDLSELLTRLDIIQGYFSNVCRCPVCHKETEDFEPREGGTFEVRCHSKSGCSAVWGIRRCSKCEKTYPYLQPGGARISDASTAQHENDNHRDLLEWLDVEYGADLLALPCWMQNARGHYICPHCEECGNGRGGCPADCPHAVLPV